jgi:hypothetical protein
VDVGGAAFDARGNDLVDQGGSPAPRWRGPSAARRRPRRRRLRQLRPPGRAPGRPAGRAARRRRPARWARRLPAALPAGCGGDRRRHEGVEGIGGGNDQGSCSIATGSTRASRRKRSDSRSASIGSSVG